MKRKTLIINAFSGTIGPLLTKFLTLTNDANKVLILNRDVKRLFIPFFPGLIFFGFAANSNSVLGFINEE